VLRNAAPLAIIVSISTIGPSGLTTDRLLAVYSWATPLLGNAAGRALFSLLVPCSE